MTEKLARIAYLSDNLIRGGDEQVSAQIDRILSSSRRRNPELNVTGALVFNRGIFAQVLEGPTDGVTYLFEKIKSDPRHCKINILESTSTTERAFPNWSMAYFGLSNVYGIKFERLAGETEFDDRLLLSDRVLSTRGVSLLRSLTMHWKMNFRSAK